MTLISKTPAASPNQDGVKFAFWNMAILIPLPPICALLIGNSPIGVGIISITLAAIAIGVVAKLPQLAKGTLAFVLLMQAMVLTASFNGHPWQIDTHMVYFAILAVISVMYDVRILIGSAAFIAVHHLGMSITMPTMLYPDMTEGFVTRTLLHAAVVVMETVILTLSIMQRQKMDNVLQAQRETVEATSKASKVAEQAAEDERRHAAEAVELLSKHLKTLAEQDFSNMIEVPLPAQYDQMRQNYNELVVNLRRVLQTASETSSDYNVSSRELSGAADDLAQRTEAQSGTLSQTADSLQSLTQTLQATADGAKQANAAASEARDSAQRNGDIVRNAVEAMKKIEESSGEISNIISMIEDISFQTNLLALNAGVEAARAGETGRGFAVVASEVRALAQRTSDAAQSVKQLIFKSSQEVETGSNLVNAAGDALSGIVDQVSEASTMIGDITVSVGQQAGVVSELNEAVQSLDKATQHNAAMCEQMTAMGHQLAQGSSVLSDALSGFQFGEERKLQLAS